MSDYQQVKIGHSVGVYADRGDHIELASVRTPRAHRGKGNAHLVMKSITRHADALRKPIRLIASPLDKKTLTHKLVDFYKKHGFELTGKTANAVGDPWMERQPRQLTDTARATSVLYHYTSPHNLLDILTQKKIKLTTSLGTASEGQQNGNKYPFYFSCTRSKIGDYTLVNSVITGAVLDLNGDWFNHRYKVAPRDYWGPEWRKASNKNEMEDRLLSKTPEIEIPDFKKVINSVHLYLSPNEDMPTVLTVFRRILIALKKNKIPFYVYTDKKSYVLQDTRKAVPQSDYVKRLRGEDTNTRKRSDFLAEYKELYYKKKKSELTKRGDNLRYLIVNYPHDALPRLQNDLHNEKSKDSARSFLSGPYKESKAKNLKEFVDMLIDKWQKITEEAYSSNASHLDIARRGFAKPVLMYHGTGSGYGSERLRSILKKGLLPGNEGKWSDVNIDAKDTSENQRSRKAYGGVYFTTNLLTAHSSATSLIIKEDKEWNLRKQNIVYICALIQPSSALPDEDFYQIHPVFKHVSKSDGPNILINVHMPKIKPYVSGERDLYNAAQALAYHYVKETERGKRPMSKVIEAAKAVVIAELERLYAHKSEANGTSKGHWAWEFEIRKCLEQRNPEGNWFDDERPKLPPALHAKPIGEAEKAYREAMNNFIKITKNYGKHELTTSGRMNLRLAEGITYKGSNRIIAVIEEIEDKNDFKKRKMIVHYGSVPESMREDYVKQIGKFPDISTLGETAMTEMASDVTDTAKYYTSLKITHGQMAGFTVDIMENPTKRELAEVSYKGPPKEVGMWIVNGNVFAWDRYGVLHNDVKDAVKADETSLPLYVTYDNIGATILITDASRHSIHHNNGSAKKLIVNNPHLKKLFPHIEEVRYYNEDEVGDWEDATMPEIASDALRGHLRHAVMLDDFADFEDTAKRAKAHKPWEYYKYTSPRGFKLIYKRAGNEQEYMVRKGDIFGIRPCTKGPQYSRLFLKSLGEGKIFTLLSSEARRITSSAEKYKPEGAVAKSAPTNHFVALHDAIRKSPPHVKTVARGDVKWLMFAKWANTHTGISVTLEDIHDAVVYRQQKLDAESAKDKVLLNAITRGIKAMLKLFGEELTEKQIMMIGLVIAKPKIKQTPTLKKLLQAHDRRWAVSRDCYVRKH